MATRPVPAFWQPSAIDTARTRYWLARHGEGDDPKSHGSAGPMCDYGFTGKDCDIPICGFQHWPQLKLNPKTKCAEITELSPLSLPMRTAELRNNLGLWIGPSFVDGVLVPTTPLRGLGLFMVLILVARTLQEHLRTLFTLALLFMTYVMSSE